jgi:hypothetical protein
MIMHNLSPVHFLNLQGVSAVSGGLFSHAEDRILSQFSLAIFVKIRATISSVPQSINQLLVAGSVGYLVRNGSAVESPIRAPRNRCPRARRDSRYGGSCR